MLKKAPPGKREKLADAGPPMYHNGMILRRFRLRFALVASAFALLAISPIARAETTPPAPDDSFREGWRLLEGDEFPAARAAFERIPAAGYDLGDFALYFQGLCLAREGKFAEAGAAAGRLAAAFPMSRLIPFLHHEIAYAAAREGKFAVAREHLARSRGRVSGSSRPAQEAYAAARLLEEDGPGPKSAAAHLVVFTSHPAAEAGELSMERLWEWRNRGYFSSWKLPISFYSEYAQGLAKAGEYAKSRAIYAEALGKYRQDAGYHQLLLDFAEALRRQGFLSKAQSLLRDVSAGLPAGLRDEADLLLARIDWRAGRLKEARAGFLAIAARGGDSPAGERARYQAAMLAGKDGDQAAAVAEFEKLRAARDKEIRRESSFRHPFGLFLQKRYPEAAAAFARGAEGAEDPAERARHTYWKGRSLLEAGDRPGADAALAATAADPEAGAYAILALRLRGDDPFAILNTPAVSAIETGLSDRESLWQRVRDAAVKEGDADRVRRAERLLALGVLEYAVLEAESLKAGVIKTAVGLAEGGGAALFRYLAGDLRGAIRECWNLQRIAGSRDMMEAMLYPLAPDLLGGLERREFGLDPLLVHSVIRQESLFQYDALSTAGAVGLMQLMPATAAQVAQRLKVAKYNRRDLLKPALNVRLGTAYLAGLVKGYDGDYFRAVAAYNAGEKAVNGWWSEAGGDPAVFIESINYAETRTYTRRVFGNLIQYYRIYRPSMYARHFPPPAAPAKPTKG
jgi:soluble lytic murein transglycosylase